MKRDSNNTLYNWVRKWMLCGLVLFNISGVTKAGVDMDSLSYARLFVDNFSAFTMNIEAAGLASIPNATLYEDGQLFIAYAYHSGNEKRAGKMTLHQVASNRYEGNWKTDADNGNSYQGSLYFVFDERGNAKGHYLFGGTKYKITIEKKDI